MILTESVGTLVEKKVLLLIQMMKTDLLCRTNQKILTHEISLHRNKIR